MKLLTTIYELKHLESLASFVDGFIIGNHQFGARLTKSYEDDEIFAALDQTKKLGKELFLVCNQMFNDEQLQAFKKWIDGLPVSQFSGVVVADLGAYKVLEQMGFSDKVIYNPETLAANVYDFNFLSEFKIKGVYVAKEITLEDVTYIANHKNYQMFMVGHGHLNMFYSKRQLIDNFMNFNLEENIYHERQDLKIIEENRLNEPFPILEDKAGTHVFRSNVFSSLNHLEELENLLDYLVIDTLFKDDEYALSVLPMYKNKKINQSVIDQIQLKYDEKWDEGFFYKKTVYIPKG
jgi:U32 family peptidase